MPITHSQYLEMVARSGMRRREERTSSAPGCAMERGLHDDIIRWCNDQWPRVKFIHARMDKKSTIATGANDFTLFLPGGRVLCIECKRKGQKQDQDQLIWATEMRMLGHEVHVVRSVDEFLKLVSETTKG